MQNEWCWVRPARLLIRLAFVLLMELPAGLVSVYLVVAQKDQVVQRSPVSDGRRRFPIASRMRTACERVGLMAVPGY